MIPSEVLNLRQGFLSHFELVPALDEKTLNQVYTIRHEVYCEELGYEAERPDHHEVDEYDRHSLHCLLRTTDDTQTLVGCTRLVLTEPAHPDEPLPIENICNGHLLPGKANPAALPRDRIAEVSRLAVRYMFRRRRGEKHEPVPVHKRDFGTIKVPRFPYIPISLYLASVAMGKVYGIEKLFMLTEPRLAEHFAKLGFDIGSIGEPLHHRGLRIPSVLDVEGTIQGMKGFMRPLWEEIYAEIIKGFRAGKNVRPSGEPMS